MTASARRTTNAFRMLLVLAGTVVWLALPGLPSNEASANKLLQPMHRQFASGLDTNRQQAMEMLYARYKAGDAFSEEEGKILRKFGSAGAITELEADVVISRALYDFYIAGKELTPQQEEVFDRYSLSVARRVTDVADLKKQLLNKRIAAAFASPPSGPLVAPANDLCSGASVIPAAGPFPLLTAVTPDITGATTTGDPSVPSCQTCITGVVSRSIWYAFTPAATATYAISSCADAPTGSTVDDTVMAIYTSTGGCAGPFTELPQACDDDGCVSEDLQSVISGIPLNAGTTYYIVIWMCDNTAPTAGNTAVQLRVSQILPPANDTCSSPTALALNTPVIGTTAAATNDYQLSGAACFTGIGQTQSSAVGGDVVYSFIAPSAGNYSFKVTGYNTTNNLVLYVATTCPTGAPPITVGTCLAAANRGAGSTSEEVSCVALSSGQTVFIFVDESFLTGGSTFTLEATSCVLEAEFPDPPSNDTPGTAGPLSFGVEGAINPAGDVDFYTLAMPPSGSRVFAFLDGVAANEPNFDMRVTTTTDTLEYDNANNDSAFGSTAPNVAGTPLTGTQSFIRINHNSASTAAEPYRLYAVVEPPGANPGCNCSASNEIESNDTPGNANSASNNFFYGSLAGPAPSTDVDCFSFTATAGDLIFLSLDGDPTRNNTPINGALALVAPDGVTMLISVNDGGQTSSTTSGTGSLTATTPNSPAEGLVWRATTTGTYFARVSIGTTSTASIGAGDYLLSISRNGQIPTLARFSNDIASRPTAVRYENGVSIRWRTQFEVDNLGFNVYRTDGSKRIRLNPEIIAGSAFVAGNNTALGAGKSYAWFDNNPGGDPEYWIESLDLNGVINWNGPVSLEEFPDHSKTGEERSSLTLGQLAAVSHWESQTKSVERRVGVSMVSKSSSMVAATIADQAVKLSVTSEGFYRVSQPELVAVGFDANLDPRNLQLFVDGQEQPINVVTASGLFDSSAAIEFYGIGVDSAATDEHVYWLVNGSHPGKRIPRVVTAAEGAASRSFLHTVELKQRMLYFSALRNGDKENFFGAIIANNPVDQVLTLPHVDTGTINDAMLEVALQGVTLVGHHIEVRVNDSPAGEVVFNGQDEGITRVPIPHSRLKEGANIIRLTPIGGSSDISLVDYVRVSYWHSFIADNNQLRFSAANRHVLRVNGFDNPQIRAFDVTNPNAPQEIAGRIEPGKTGYSITLRSVGTGTRQLLAITNDSANRPTNIKLDLPSHLRQPGNAAKLVIVTPRDFVEAIAPLKILRQSQGYNVAVVDIEDIYDEFSYGNKTPQAIRDFLVYARGNWTIAPSFVMLVGDASYDPKNFLGFGNHDIVPTKLIDTQLMETASDDWLADFDGDGLAEMAVGRLPARCAREAATMVARIVQYDQTAPPAGVLLVADDSSDGVDFQATSNELHNLIPDDQRIEQIDRGSLDPVTAKTRLLDAINRGQKVVSYNGHGNLDSWRGSLLTSEDINVLRNRQLSLFVMMTCLNGYFHDAQNDSLAESLIKAENGGAVAVWASSAMTLPSDHGVMSVEMFRQLFDTHKTLTLGEASRLARRVALNKDVRLTWILLGDPTTRLR